MTLIDVDRLAKHAGKSPTTRMAACAIAARLGIEFKMPQPKRYTTPEEFAAMVRATGGRIEGVARM
jgi:hypothetical protein